MVWRPARLNLRSSTRFWEINSALRGTDKLLCTLGPRGKAVTSQELGPDHGFEWSLVEAGAAVAPCRNEDINNTGIMEY